MRTNKLVVETHLNTKEEVRTLTCMGPFPPQWHHRHSSILLGWQCCKNDT